VLEYGINRSSDKNHVQFQFSHLIGHFQMTVADAREAAKRLIELADEIDKENADAKTQNDLPPGGQNPEGMGS
jgi:hypothetical protein